MGTTAFPQPIDLGPTRTAAEAARDASQALDARVPNSPANEAGKVATVDSRVTGAAALEATAQVIKAKTDIAGSVLNHFGDGSDGTVVINTTVTLTRAMHYQDLTVTATGIIDTAGFAVYVAGTLTIDAGGRISNDAGDGGTPTAGAVPAGVFGAAGGAGGSTSTGGNGGLNSTGSGGSGGAGAPSNSPRSGGTAGLASGGRLLRAMADLVYGWYQTGTGFQRATGGGGGGGGGADSANAGGGGGGGGGRVLIVARAVVNNGTIRANGGNGGPAAVGHGNGGGGGGGIVIVVTFSAAVGGTLQANGGAAGNGAGNAAGAGAAGLVIVRTA